MRKTPRYTIMSIEEALQHGYRYIVIQVTPRGEVLNSGYFYFAHNAEVWCRMRILPDDHEDDTPETDELPF